MNDEQNPVTREELAETMWQSTNCYVYADLILAKFTVLHPAPAADAPTELIAELNFLPEFVLGTIKGKPLPLADFTRERIAKALTDAAKILTNSTTPVSETRKEQD